MIISHHSKASRQGVIWLVLLLQLAFPATSWGEPQDSLIAASNQVSEFEARLTLARLLASQGGKEQEAIREYRILLRQRPGTVNLRLEMAQLLIRLKNYPQAMSELEAILQQSPSHPAALMALARLNLWTGKHQEAIRLLERLRHQGRLPVDALVDLAKAYTWTKQYPQAIQAYQEALPRIPRPEANLLAEVGDVYLYAGQLTRAVDYYRQALALEPQAEPLRKKLALALSWSKQNEEALTLLLPLQKQFPADKEISLELMRVYAKTDRTDQAIALGRMLIDKFPRDAAFLVELADLELGRGHAQTCRDLYSRALQLSGGQEKMVVHVADQMNMWGDFYRLESIYRDYLKKHVDDFSVQLKLAWALVSSQRYEEAEGLYRQLLLKQPQSIEPLLGLIKLKLMEKDFQGGLDYAKQLLQNNPHHPEGLKLQGELRLRLQRWPEALTNYQELARIASQRAQGLVGTGKVWLNQQEKEQARAAFNQAFEAAPKDVEVQYYHAGAEATSPGFVEHLTGAGQESPMRLVQWAQLYAADGFNKPAIACYRAALDQDSHCFPAQIGLAEILGADNQYDGALEILRSLAEEFPGNPRVWISWARVLGWSKNYERSIEVYKKIREANLVDPVPRKEMARTAAWGKMMLQARKIYANMCEPPVDKSFGAALEALAAQEGDPSLRELVNQAKSRFSAESVYQGYEFFWREFPQRSAELSPQVRKRLEELLLEFYPAYRVQKAATLESRAKWQAWNRRLTPSKDTYEELIDTQPGNQEAVFDYAQVQCALGLCDSEAKTYKGLLLLDPLHNRAGMALERQQIRSNPAVRVGQSYWEEKGTGQHAVSQIARFKTDGTIDIPLTCQHHLMLSAHHWLEQPKERQNFIGADGHSLEFAGQMNAYFKYNLRWTRKYYEDSKYPDSHTGLATFWFNLRDYAHLGLGYERTDEIYNYYGIQQGTQADRFWVGLNSFITRKLEMKAQSQYISYNDSNSGHWHSLFLGYWLTDHPRVLKLALRGDYRDSLRTNRYLFNGTNLMDIIYPYWTPKNYLGGALIIEWYHDISKFFFCGSDLHFYDLRLILGSDTTGNNIWGLEAEWNYEFRKHWSFNLKGMIQRSSQWNANAAWAILQYRF